MSFDVTVISNLNIWTSSWQNRTSQKQRLEYRF